MQDNSQNSSGSLDDQTLIEGYLNFSLSEEELATLETRMQDEDFVSKLREAADLQRLVLSLDPHDIEIDPAQAASISQTQQAREENALDAIMGKIKVAPEKTTTDTSDPTNSLESPPLKAPVSYLKQSTSRQKRTKRKSPFGIAAAFTALAFACVVAIFLINTNEPIQHDRSDPRVLKVVSGEIELTHDQNVSTVSKGDKIIPGTRFKILSEGKAKLAYPDGSTLEISQFSQGNFSDSKQYPQAKHVSLLSGVLRAKIEPQTEDQPAVIFTPNATTHVIGTEFTLKVDYDYDSLEVTKGKVLYGKDSSSEGSIVQAGFMAGQGPEVDFVKPSEPGYVERFTMVTVGRGKPVQGYEDLQDGARISLDELPKRGINLAISLRGNYEKLRIKVSGNFNENEKTIKDAEVQDGYYTRIESIPPYTLGGDFYNADKGRINFFEWVVEKDTYTIEATPLNADGTPTGETEELRLTFY
ncbi:MAG: FecR domain-containing protein [Opitutales bacterium]